MALLDIKPELADVIGVPVFFIQETWLENLGDGTVRIAGCIKQNGLLVPQYYAVMSISTLRRCSAKNALMAGELLDVVMREEFARH